MPILEIADPGDTALLCLQPLPDGKLEVMIRTIDGPPIAFVALERKRVTLLVKAFVKFLETGKVL